MTYLNLLMWLVSLLAAPTIRDLGDSHWPTRDAASKRLAALGHLAYPVTWLTGANAEADRRLDLLHESIINNTPSRVVAWACNADRLSDDWIVAHREEILEYAESRGPNEIEMPSGVVVYRESVRWGCYYGGTESEEQCLRVILKAQTRTHKIVVPKRMPETLEADK